MKKLWAAIVAIAAVAVSGCGYNDIQRQDEGVTAAWSEVVKQLKPRPWPR